MGSHQVVPSRRWAVVALVVLVVTSWGGLVSCSESQEPVKRATVVISGSGKLTSVYTSDTAAPVMSSGDGVSVRAVNGFRRGTTTWTGLMNGSSSLEVEVMRDSRTPRSVYRAIHTFDNLAIGSRRGGLVLEMKGSSKGEADKTPGEHSVNQCRVLSGTGDFAGATGTGVGVGDTYLKGSVFAYWIEIEVAAGADDLANADVEPAAGSGDAGAITMEGTGTVFSRVTSQTSEQVVTDPVGVVFQSRSAEASWTGLIDTGAHPGRSTVRGVRNTTENETVWREVIEMNDVTVGSRTGGLVIEDKALSSGDDSSGSGARSIHEFTVLGGTGDLSGAEGHGLAIGSTVGTMSSSAYWMEIELDGRAAAGGDSAKSQATLGTKPPVVISGTGTVNNKTVSESIEQLASDPVEIIMRTRSVEGTWTGFIEAGGTSNLPYTMNNVTQQDTVWSSVIRMDHVKVGNRKGGLVILNEASGHGNLLTPVGQENGSSNFGHYTVLSGTGDFKGAKGNGMSVGGNIGTKKRFFVYWMELELQG